MSLSTLHDLFPEMRALGNREALLFDNGFRTWRMTYLELWGQIGGFTRFLTRSNLKKGDRVVLWSENRLEWVVAFWGCVAQGVQVVPVDYGSSLQLLKRICHEVQAGLVILGESVERVDLPFPTTHVLDVARFGWESEAETAPVSPDDIVQIVYTSGTTGEPRGVIHRHRNICANLNPIRTEIRKYLHYARPFQPIRILNLLPLSHMFGQSLGLFVPPLLEGAAAFLSDLRPDAAISTIRRERISVLAAVPKMASNLRTELERRFDLPLEQPLGRGWSGAARRWWRFRKVHRLFGLKFWALILGGAEVSPQLEAFWSRLGFAVIQGYGLTESSPVIAVNHPFSTRQGSIGKPVEGQIVKLGPDGEILVRGDSVASERLGPGARLEALTEDGWLHTGDIGEIDSEGRIYFRGRKKDLIVSSSGLNVYPQDVEAVLKRLPEIRDAVVVARRFEDEERVHAALLLADPLADPARAVAQANHELEAHQRISSWSLWPDEDFPRTPSTLKVKRTEVAAVVNAETGKPETEQGRNELEELLARMSGRDSVRDQLRLSEDLGLSSLDRVELLSRLEDRYGVRLDEEIFSSLSSVGEVRKAVKDSAQLQAPAAAEKDLADLMPRWGQKVPVRWFRRLSLNWILLPSFRILIDLRAEGVEALNAISPPVIFAANHNSHFDVPSIMQALPVNWRNRVAPAMLQDYFLAHFRPTGFSLRFRLRNSLKYVLACGLFGAYPLPHKLAGVRNTLRYTGELAQRGLCPLVFPEGIRSPDGSLQPFKPGIGLMALRLGVPVVPIHIAGTFEAWPLQNRWPQSGIVRVAFGEVLELSDSANPEAATARVEAAIRRLQGDSLSRSGNP